LYRDGVIFTGSTYDRIEPGPLGVRRHVKSRAFDGYTLFSPAFGYMEYLIDMNGLVVHRWPVEHSQLAELLPNGNLLYDNYGYGLKEIRPDGTVVWSWEGPYHHDFQRLPDGDTILLIGRETPVIDGFYSPGLEPKSMWTDFVIRINSSGDVIWEFSFAEHVEEIRRLSGLPSPVRYVKRDGAGREEEWAPSDWAHTNTIEVLPDTPLGREDSRFRRGNLLFSFRALDIIGVIDPRREEIVWAWGLGILDGQHQPTMLEDGHILVFDNGTYRNWSREIEMDPATGEIVWSYDGGSKFFSPFRSGVQRLPNGNTLVCESDAGRIFEVTREGEVVWDYWSPFMGQGPENQGRHIYRATRYTEEEVCPLLQSRTERIVGVADAKGEALTTFTDALKYYQRSLDP